MLNQDTPRMNSQTTIGGFGGTGAPRHACIGGFGGTGAPLPLQAGGFGGTGAPC